MNNKIFSRSENGIEINDFEKALQIAKSERYYNLDYDISLSSLNALYNRAGGNEFTALFNFYFIGKLQGIKQGIAYQKGTQKQNDLQ